MILSNQKIFCWKDSGSFSPKVVYKTSSCANYQGRSDKRHHYNLKESHA